MKYWLSQCCRDAFKIIRGRGPCEEINMEGKWRKERFLSTHHRSSIMSCGVNTWATALHMISITESSGHQLNIIPEMAREKGSGLSFQCVQHTFTVVASTSHPQLERKSVFGKSVWNVNMVCRALSENISYGMISVQCYVAYSPFHVAYTFWWLLVQILENVDWWVTVV